MITWQQFLAEKNNVTHDFSSTQFNFPDDISDKIINWGKKNIPDSEISEASDNSGGREDEIHVTVLYGIHDGCPKETEKLLKDVKPFKITLGKTSFFSNEKFDVLKLEVNSQDLKALNKLLSEKLEFTNKYTYVPHVTIAYMKNGTAKKYANDDTFMGIKIQVSEIVFSSKDGDKIPIKLG
jgi:hypothetical protein